MKWLLVLTVMFAAACGCLFELTGKFVATMSAFNNGGLPFESTWLVFHYYWMLVYPLPWIAWLVWMWHRKQTGGGQKFFFFISVVIAMLAVVGVLYSGFYHLSMARGGIF